MLLSHHFTLKKIIIRPKFKMYDLNWIENVNPFGLHSFNINKLIYLM